MINKFLKILETVAALEETVEVPGFPGIKKAFPVPPADPDSSLCPFVINEIRGGPITAVAQGYEGIRTTVLIWVCVGKVDSEATASILQLRALEYRDPFLQMFARNTQLGGVADFLLTGEVTHWDIAPKEIGTSRYLALLLTLSVSEMYLQPLYV